MLSIDDDHADLFVASANKDNIQNRYRWSKIIKCMGILIPITN